MKITNTPLIRPSAFHCPKLRSFPNGNEYCFIWETYSTDEATYVWKLVSDSKLELENNFEHLVELVKSLRANNKMSYLKNKPENFKRIEHDYAGDDFGFKKWKSQLEEFLLKSIISVN